MYLPAVALMIVLHLPVNPVGVHISLTNWNGYSQTYTKYVGLQNCRKLFNDVMFHTAFSQTPWFTLRAAR